jgi:hypothetical protein
MRRPPCASPIRRPPCASPMRQPVRGHPSEDIRQRAATISLTRSAFPAQPDAPTSMRQPDAPTPACAVVQPPTLPGLLTARAALPTAPPPPRSPLTADRHLTYHPPASAPRGRTWAPVCRLRALPVPPNCVLVASASRPAGLAGPGAWAPARRPPAVPRLWVPSVPLSPLSPHSPVGAEGLERRTSGYEIVRML